jgi:hypothetical protein
MKKILRRITVFMTVVATIGATGPAETPPAHDPSQFVLDMVHHNPGEAKCQTMFLDPVLLKSWGFNGDVPREFVQCAVTFDSFDKDIFRTGSPEREWVEENARRIDALIKAMKAQGLPCYPFTDFIVLPRRMVEKYRADISDDRGRIDIFRPKTKEILRAMLDEVFTRFPDLGGITVRHGETYLHDTPYHTGGNPILRGADSHVELINFLREEICVKRDKVLIYRTWDFGQMHDRPEIYLGATDRVAPHTNLLFSIKYQMGDFHRLSRFNPCLGIGKHRQIVEVQCQPEAYGKGAYPYYVGQGVIDGWEEYASRAGPKGLRDIVNDWRYAGTWTWSRGGGWRGPYIPNEFWCEMNTYVVAKWAQNPKRTEEDVFNEFARVIAGITDTENRARLRQIALLSAAGTLRSQNSLVHKLDVWWNRDQNFGDITGQLKDVAKAGQTDAFLKEKTEATAMWREIEALSRALRVPDPKLAEFIRVSCTYGRIKCEIIEQMCRAILWGLTGDARASEAIVQYDQLWDEWRKLRAEHPGSCATLYTDTAFSFAGGVPGDVPGMGAAINQFRNKP